MNSKPFIITQYIDEALFIFVFQLFVYCSDWVISIDLSVLFLCHCSSTIEPTPKYFTLVIMFLYLKFLFYFIFLYLLFLS